MKSDSSEFSRALSTVPPGRWGVGVSGGADSVALLRLTLRQPRLTLHVIHLDHETRSGESAADAAFVRSLSKQFGLPHSVARISEVNINDANNNPPARFRAARLEWFGNVVKSFGLDGVLLAHHFDDQAETVAQRLLRGRQPAGLRGMARDTEIDGLRLLRPLLGIPRDRLRIFLNDIGQSWVEDASNASAMYQRNRLRMFLAENVELRDALIRLGSAGKELSGWLERSSPVLAAAFDTNDIARLPLPLARHSAGRWLREQGVPPDELSPGVCDRLISLAGDRAGPARAEFPGAVRVVRKCGIIRAAR